MPPESSPPSDEETPDLTMDKDNPPPPPEPEPVADSPVAKSESRVEVEEERPPTPPVVKPIMEDEEIFKDPLPKKKRVASQKQLEHLANARKKAQEKKRIAKEQKEKDNAIKKVLSKEVREKNPKQEHTLLNLSKDDLQALTERAIEGYDTKRRARKQKKRAEQEETKKIQAVHTSISRAVKQPDTR